MKNNIFEEIKHINKNGMEYWKARELYKLLGYAEYSKFIPVIIKAQESCKNSKQAASDHFAHVGEMIKIASGTEKEALRKINDFHLSRYACYLIAQNGDPRKEEIALAQTYFALQTRRQEINEQLMEDQKRVFLREDLSGNNKKLFKAAKQAGVNNYANFQDYGYMGLYNGLRQKDIHTKKKLKPNEKILDRMGSEELAANLFRATQTEAKLKRENIIGEQKANRTHHEVGKTVRNTIKKLGGTMPEKLPTPDHIKGAKKRLKEG
jgi:DNA-damage-inducible protein D